MSIECVKMARGLQLLGRVKYIERSAHDHRMRDQAIVIVFGQIAAKLDAAQTHADGHDLMVLVTIVHVIDHQVEVFIVGGAIGASRFELHLDATIVHDHGFTAMAPRFLHKVSHVVVFGAAGQAREND